MKALQSTDNAQESKIETLENQATYRAPRLVALGTAEGLVQLGATGRILDNGTAGNNRDFRY
jgi:hypothetical protein